ncbi:3-oxoacyl-ACP synthase III family protein [Crossiella sp. CA198]|uniref:3-oxoacyl-ACP synthase III family protein n=1 Tax=Crossiella sp. CA198 TaxID=3455607 RepID=UPI003F8D628A
MTAAGILSMGACVPKDEIRNEDIADRFGVTPDWFVQRTGVRTRRYAAPDEAVSDLSIRAAEQALERAGVAADRVTHLIMATSTPDAPLPPTSSLVQDAIGARNTAAFDLNASCNGFLHGVALARNLVRGNPDELVLVIGADIYSRFIDPNHRGTVALFGDGAGAALIGAVPDGLGLQDIELRSHGEAASILGIDAGGSRLPATPATLIGRKHFVRMDGKAVAQFVLGEVPGLVARVLDQAGVDPATIDHFVPHQANGVVIEELVRQVGFTGQTHLTLDRYGNLGSGSMPVTLEDAWRRGAFAVGDLVLLAGFGSGMNLGAGLLRWSAPPIGVAETSDPKEIR